MNELCCINLNTTSPALNLAAEQYVFDFLPKDRSYFMLWQNDNAVIIGKYQNALSEINEPYLRANNISLVRRLSGGGAVYHDLGNLNYTFITDAEAGESMNMRAFCLPVIRVLEKMGVTAEINGRNDMVIEGKKFSGNSQYVKNGRIMHHGTLMFSSNLDRVQQVLTPDKEKLAGKGIASVRSRVTNISDHLQAAYSLEDFRRLLLEEIMTSMEGTMLQLPPEAMAEIEELSRTYSSWEWNFGRSPACTLKRSGRIEGCGRLETYLSIDHGLVSDLVFRGDFLTGEAPEKLCEILKGARADREGYLNALGQIQASRYIRGLTNDALVGFLTGKQAPIADARTDKGQ